MGQVNQNEIDEKFNEWLKGQPVDVQTMIENRIEQLVGEIKTYRQARNEYKALLKKQKASLEAQLKNIQTLLE